MNTESPPTRKVEVLTYTTNGKMDYSTSDDPAIVELLTRMKLPNGWNVDAGPVAEPEIHEFRRLETGEKRTRPIPKPSGDAEDYETKWSVTSHKVMEAIGAVLKTYKCPEYLKMEEEIPEVDKVDKILDKIPADGVESLGVPLN